MGFIKDAERWVKKLRGKSVPALEGVEIPQEIADLLSAAQKLISREAMEMLSDVKEKAWALLESCSPGIMPRAAFDAAVKALTDAIRGELA